MNLTFILAALIAWGVSIAGASYIAFGLGQDNKTAEYAKISKAIDDTYDKALAGASTAISQIEVKNVTINRKLETKVRTERVFVDCRSGDDSVRLYNSGIEGASESVDRGKLPATDAARK